MVALLSLGCGDRASSVPVEPPIQPMAAGIEFATDSPQPASKEDQSPSTTAGGWSKPANGLSARLLVVYEEITSGKHPTYFHYHSFILEVKNVGTEAVSLISQPSFTDLAIRDAEGKELHGRGYDGNHVTGASEWAVIPTGAYLGLRVDTTIPVNVGLYFESFATEDHSLHATLIAEKEEGPQNQWIGRIELPPVHLVRKR